ncbi:CACTA en-spm transposon protein [Cucumis melo var. makuwa]|uniref:CACTA en-spm transposon protein n=1 Tax=Cucumis melo var. makuwa TaxID=1194695 RepID=A0A5D3DYQ5_CUCMM|nr:CACTA en-spm transposon protein [Cucumis melo var. makuwa]
MRQEFSNKKPSFSSVKNITEKEEEKGNLRDRETIVEELATVIVLAAVHRPTICRRLPLLLIILHQMLSTWKGFRGDNHRHIKKFSDLEEARANPP